MTFLLKDKLIEEGKFPRLSRKIRLGIVGGGRIAATQAMAARMTGFFEIVAGALSSNPDVAGERAADYHIAPERSYGCFSKMAEMEAGRDDGVELVMITTPNHLHYPAAQQFINSGVAIMCDKPLVNEISEAEMLVTSVKEKGTIFSVGYVMSCFAMVREAKEIISQGALGNIRQIHVEFLQDWMVPENSHEADHVKWRLDPKKSGKTSCVGDIGTHAAHLSSFVTGHRLTDLRAEFHVCGAPKPLEDTVFMNTVYDKSIPGTLIATRLASGNRGGLRLRVFGEKGGLEWDLEYCDQLKLNLFGKPDQVITRGHGHGVSLNTERMVRTGRGFPEGIIEAWANLYSELAIAIACKADGVLLPKNFTYIPKVEDGADGVRFIEAAVASNNSGGAWVAV